MCLNFVEIIFISLSIHFLLKLDKVQSIKRKSCILYTLILIIMANVGLWLYTFFQETRLLHVLPDTMPSGPYTDIVSACLNDSTNIDEYIYGSVIYLYYPMCLEYALVAMEIILHVWFIHSQMSNMQQDNDSHEEHAVVSNEDEMFYSIESHQPRMTSITANVRPRNIPINHDSPTQSTSSVLDDRELSLLTVHVHDTSSDENQEEIEENVQLLDAPYQNHPFLWRGLSLLNRILGFKLAIAIEVVEFVLLKWYIIFDESRSEGYISNWFFKTHIKWPILWFRVLVTRIISTVCSILCYIVLKKLTVKKSTEPGVTAIDTVLIICVVSIVLMTGIEITICIIDMNDSTTTQIPICIENILIIVHYSSQAAAIHHGISRDLRKGSFDVNPLFEFLSTYNFCRWVVVTAVEV